MGPRPTEIRLDQALLAIASHVADVCTDATAPGSLLEGITEVVRGDRARRRPNAPYLWVAVGTAMADQAHANHETWTVPLLLNAFVASEEPQDAWLEAHMYAARARSVVLADRTLGDELGFVGDTTSAELGPLGQFTQRRQFGAYARLNTLIAIVEPKEQP